MVPNSLVPMSDRRTPLSLTGTAYGYDTTSCLLFLKDAGDLLRSSHNRRPSLGLRTLGQGGLRKRHMQLKDERE